VSENATHSGNQMRRFIAIYVMLLIFTPSAVSAQPKTYAKVGDWTVTQTTSESCFALLFYGEISLAVDYNAKTGHVVLYLENDNATSIASDQKISMTLIFTKRNQADHGWGEQEFTTHISNDGKPMFSSGWFNTEMLRDIAENDYLLVMYGDKLVSGAKLDDSSKMVSKLRECSVQAANLNPKDPFIP
jgi:hypothetical protein